MAIVDSKPGYSVICYFSKINPKSICTRKSVLYFLFFVVVISCTTHSNIQMAISTWISINLLCINSTIRCCYEKKKVNLDCIKVFQGITKNIIEKKIYISISR